MNAKQQTAIRMLTSNIERFNRMSTGEAMYGPIYFTTEELAGNMIMVRASNNSEDRRWFDKMVHIIATVGPRGGVKIRSCTGFPSSVI